MSLPQGTVTFLFTDIEGSTDLARRFGATFGRLRSEHRQVLREAFGAHGGHEIDTAGDGFFVAFEKAGDAVAAAIAVQRGLSHSQVRVRVGLHSAEPYLDKEGYTGVGVHRAARICAAGHGGQILLSNATAGIVEDLGLGAVELHDLGEHRLKDIDRPQRLFQIVAEGLESEFPPLKSLDTAGSIKTLLAVDVSGWGQAIRTFGDERMTEAARRLHRLAAAELRRNGGRELEMIADNLLAAFERPLDAFRAAKGLREALRSEPWFPGDEPPTAAMAIHSGRIADLSSRHLGSTGFRVFSLCDSAEAGEILVSHATEALIEGEVSDFELRDLGERTLKRFDRPARVFELV